MPDLFLRSSGEQMGRLWLGANKQVESLLTWDKKESLEDSQWTLATVGEMQDGS